MIQRLLRNIGRDSGMALVSVIAVGAVLAILVTAGVSYSLGGLNKASNDQDWNGALGAAYAGVEEYQSLLAANSAYVRFGNAASEYTTPTDPDRVSTVTAPPETNPALGVGVTGTWATVAGSNGMAQYRYEVNNSTYDLDGAVTVRATGRVGDATRTIVADLKQSGFVEYVYFTDLETKDPESLTSKCNWYAWANPPRPSNCTNIVFDNNDVINGDVHSNDRMIICKATFNGRVTTEYNPASIKKYSSDGCASGNVPVFSQGDPVYTGHIEMPPTNAQLKKEVRTDLTGSDVPNPGCLYTGPTSIVFTSDGKMKVRSPWTKSTQVAGEPAASGTAPSKCGSVADLKSTTGASVAVPDNNVIFVQDVPEGGGNPNSWDWNTVSPGDGTTEDCKKDEKNNPVGYPKTNEKAGNDAYRCRNGDVFVQGVLNGKVTVASDNYVYVTGDLTYADANDDVLGLVGQNAVYVWNPIDNQKNCLNNGAGQNYCNTNRTIQAAILSVGHTFTVQNYTEIGNRGELRMTGSIAQKYRGPVGTGTSTSISDGYKKVYAYDSRFKYTAPPKFLAPLSTTYGVTTWIESVPAFDADGSYRD